MRFPTTPAASSPTSCLMGLRPGASVNLRGRRWKSACGQPSRAGTSTHGGISIIGARWDGGAGVREGWGRTLSPNTVRSGCLPPFGSSVGSCLRRQSPHRAEQKGTQLNYAAWWTFVHVSTCVYPKPRLQTPDTCLFVGGKIPTCTRKQNRNQ